MGFVLGRKPEHETIVFFRLKLLQPAMKGTSCAAVAGCGRFCRECVPPLCSATSGGSCVHRSIGFLNLWLQITVEWLHDLLSSGVAMCVERCGLAT